MVFLDTVQVGVTPQVLQLKPGRYEIELFNPELNRSKKKHLLVKAGARIQTLVELEGDEN